MIRKLMTSLPAKLLAVLTGLLLLEAAPSASQASPVLSTDPVLMSQRRFPPRAQSRFPSRPRYRPRSRYPSRIPRRLARPQRRLLQPQPPVQRRLPSPSRRLSWSVRPIAPAAYRWGGLARGTTDCIDKQISAKALLPEIRKPPESQSTTNPTTNSTTIRTTDNSTNLDLGQPDLTLQSHPTFWIHVDGLPRTIADFTIQNIEGTQQLYDAQFEIDVETDGGTGLIGITMPDSAPPSRNQSSLCLACAP